MHVVRDVDRGQFEDYVHYLVYQLFQFVGTLRLLRNCLEETTHLTECKSGVLLPTLISKLYVLVVDKYDKVNIGNKCPWYDDDCDEDLGVCHHLQKQITIIFYQTNGF